MLKAVANIPKGNAPIPNDIWKPPSPNPKPWNPPLFSGSGLCPWGRGGVFSLGSCCPVLPLPYKGITLSRLIPALHTGHTCLFGLVSSHWCKQGQQKRCPHRLITASLAVSKQMLHSKVLSWLVLSPEPLLLLLPLVPPVLELFVDAEVVGPLLAILKNYSGKVKKIFLLESGGSGLPAAEPSRAEPSRLRVFLQSLKSLRHACQLPTAPLRHLAFSFQVN